MLAQGRNKVWRICGGLCHLIVECSLWAAVTRDYSVLPTTTTLAGAKKTQRRVAMDNKEVGVEFLKQTACWAEKSVEAIQ